MEYNPHKNFENTDRLGVIRPGAFYRTELPYGYNPTPPPPYILYRHRGCIDDKHVLANHDFNKYKYYINQKKKNEVDDFIALLDEQ